MADAEDTPEPPVAATGSVDCARGRHAPLVEQPPDDRGDCVNVDQVCPACGTRVSVTSWTKAHWLATQQKLAARVAQRTARASRPRGRRG